MQETKLSTIKLLNRRISEFKDIAGKTAYHNRHTEKFLILTSQTAKLLARLFGPPAGKEFIKSITFPEDGTPMSSEQHFALRRKKLSIILHTLKTHLKEVEARKG